jgi:hypothetical protein
LSAGIDLPPVVPAKLGTPDPHARPRHRERERSDPEPK